MGNSNDPRQLQVAQVSQPGEWVSEGSTGYSALIRNLRTGLLAQQYTILSEQRIDRYQDYQIYEYRREQNDNIVTVYEVQKEANPYMCQGEEYTRVKTEHIPYRLSEINNLGFSEGLYILGEALIGYMAITDFIGSVHINDQMIGFTPEHRVKVWLNDEFACNLPREGTNFQFRPKSTLEHRDPETISLLFQVVGEHMLGGKFPEGFERAFRQYPMHTFSEAIQFIKEYSEKSGTQQRQSLVSNLHQSQSYQQPLSPRVVCLPKQDVVQPIQYVKTIPKQATNRVIHPVQQPKVVVSQIPTQLIPVQRHIQPSLIKTFYVTNTRESARHKLPQHKEHPPLVRVKHFSPQRVERDPRMRPFRASEVVAVKQLYRNTPNFGGSSASTQIKVREVMPFVEDSRHSHKTQSQVNIMSTATLQMSASRPQPCSAPSTSNVFIKESPVIYSQGAFLKKAKNLTAETPPSPVKLPIKVKFSYPSLRAPTKS